MGGLGNGDFSSIAHWQLLAENLSLRDSGWACTMEGKEQACSVEEKERGIREMIKVRPLQEAQRPKFHDPSVQKLGLQPRCV